MLHKKLLTYDDPPSLLSLGGEEWGDDGAGHLVLSLQLHLHVDRLTRGQAALVLHLVLQLNVRVPAQRPTNALAARDINARPIHKRNANQSRAKPNWDAQIPKKAHQMRNFQTLRRRLSKSKTISYKWDSGLPIKVAHSVRSI